MKLGYFTMPLHPVGRDWRQTLAEDREAILLAEKLGFEEAFVGEHVTDLAETVTSCLIFIATLARDTSRIKLGSGTVNLANRHPAATAAEIAMVDTLLEGRFILGVGPGGLRSDAEMFENLDADRNAIFVESMEHMIALWTKDPPYQLQGKRWKLTTERTWIRAGCSSPSSGRTRPSSSPPSCLPPTASPPPLSAAGRPSAPTSCTHGW
jgi:alkanesulfonate monooxygenase SsuD/methylene tetrahydromethanopterin reductase-like flavin-dependent oxidoreductase (luciferase family)